MVKQIEIKGYTRTGFEVVVRDNVQDNHAAKKLIDSVSALGLLPARPEKPDEIEEGLVSHVALTHTEDGTPHVAFFHQNEKLEKRWTHKYLNTEPQRKDFEAWSGLKLADMPAKEGNSHPQRSTKAVDLKYMVALPQPMVLIRVTEYKREMENGQEVWKPENDVQSYIGKAKVVPPPAGTPPLTPPRIQGGESKSDDVPGEMVFWWQSDFELQRVKAWEIQARASKPQYIEAALKKIAPMKDFATSEAYIAALKQIAANEEAKASGEEIPF